MGHQIAFVFPGQGSQSVGMLNAFEQNALVKQTVQTASDSIQQDLWNLIQNGPAEKLTLTENTQPVMLATSIAIYRAWLASGGKEPNILAGHSLGEYTALVASQILSLEQAVPLVQFRAKAMQESVQVGTGAMAAIVGMADEKIIQLCSEVSLLSGKLVEAVNFNAPSQVVVAGYVEAVDKLIEMAKPAGAKLAVKLPVSAPFHSTLLKPAAQKLEEYLKNVTIQTPSIEVINNVDVLIENQPEKIKDALIRQAYSPVRWVQIIEKMRDLGITHIVECGPGKVLAGLVKRIAPQIQALGISDPASIEAVLTELNK